MSFLLDTNICSAHMRQSPGLASRFIQHMGRLAIPTLVLGELWAGACLRADPAPLHARIDDLLIDLDVLDFASTCAEEFGRLRGVLDRRGVVVPRIDLLIASVAVAFDLTLVTHNTADFAQIPDLRLADWLIP